MLNLPDRGVAVLHGNTLDVYPIGPGKKALTLLELIQRNAPHPVVYTTGGKPMPLRIPEETWREYEKLMAPMLEGVKSPLGPIPPSPAQVLEACLVLARAHEVCVVVDYAEALLADKEWDAGCCSSAHVRIILRACDEPLKGLILLICRHSYSVLHPALRGAHTPIQIIDLPMPDEPARTQFAGKKASRLGGLTLRQLASTEGDDALLKQAKHVERATEGMLTARWCNTPWEHIGGLDYVLRYLQSSILPAFKRRDRYSPVGVIATGPPGVGKSIVAEAVATELGEPLFEAFAGFIKSSFVGENERIMETMLRVLDGTGGILYLDEGDKMFSSLDAYQGDSGVQTRVIGAFMQWLGDAKRRGKVLTIMSMNRPHALPASMRRAGRFDIVLPFFPPLDAGERLAIILALAKRHELEPEGDAWGIFSQKSDWWTSADLEAALISIAREDGARISIAAVEQTLRNMRPAIPQELMREMNKVTANECRDKRLLPPPQKLARVT